MIDIDANGIGIGKSSAAAMLDVKAPAVTRETMAKFTVADDSTGSLIFDNGTGSSGQYRPRIIGTAPSDQISLFFLARLTSDTGTRPGMVFNISQDPTGSISTRPLWEVRNDGTARFILDAAGNASATSFNPTSSRELKEGITELDSAKAAEALSELKPVEYAFKADRKEPRVGFIAEDVPELVANVDRKTLSSMDVVAVVTKVVKDQQRTIEEQNKMIAKLAERLDQLENELQAQK
jgi:hypothetical protein